MNAFLANAIGALNTLVALALIIAGAGIGASTAGVMGGEVGAIGLFMGAVGGAIVAVLVCGSLALLIGIRDELKEIRRALDAR